jgi:hypothetical protein
LDATPVAAEPRVPEVPNFDATAAAAEVGVPEVPNDAPAAAAEPRVVGVRVVVSVATSAPRGLSPKGGFEN